MNRTDVINRLIQKYNYKTYLEVGVRDMNANFNNIHIDYKESCDIAQIKGLTYNMTSDEMFEQMDKDKKFDIIFIDAMHDESYADRDIHNSLKHLNIGGVICIHDVLPTHKSMTVKKEKYDDSVAWTGDVYKSIAKLYGTDIDYVTVDNGDYGLGIIRYNKECSNDLDKKCEYSYEDLFNDMNHFGKHITELGKKVLHVIQINDPYLK